MSAALDTRTDLQALLAHVEKTFSTEEQEELLAYARDIETRRTGFYDMTEEEEAAVLDGLAQAERGEIVSEEELREDRRRYGL